ncbi:MAG: outer membrane beta-barrel protein [Alphaproteobacteria bacterium]|nr:outer membrane beta-barrel protein [Alphaproteobacteria bacterium]
MLIGSIALAQTAGIPLPSLAPSATLDLQPLLPGAKATKERLEAAGLTADPTPTPGLDPGAPAAAPSEIQPLSPVTEAAQKEAAERGGEAETDARSRFDRIRDEREARQVERDADKKTRLAAEARPFADTPFGLTAFEDTVRNRARPDFESYGLVLDDLWRRPLSAAGVVEPERLADNPSGLELFVGGAVERGISSNVFRSDLNETSDGITLARTRLDLISDFDLWSLSASFRSEHARHDDEGSEDYDDFGGRVGFATEYEDFLLFSGEGLLERRHILRGSIDDLGAVTPTGGRNDLVAFTRATGAARFILGQSDGFFVRPQIRYSTSNYDDLVGTDLVTGDSYDSSDFDRDETTFSLRVGKRLLRRQALFLEGRYTLNDFDNTADRFGFNRDSKTWLVTGGVELEPTFVTALDLEAGYFDRSFEDASLENVDGLFVRARGVWNPTPVMTVTGSLDRSVQSTLGGTGGSTILTDGRVRLDWDPLENLILSAQGGYAVQDFQAQDRSDDLYVVGVEADYMINEFFFVSARADRINRNSSIDGFDFTENRAFLEIGVRLCCQSENGQAGFLPRSYP